MYGSTILRHSTIFHFSAAVFLLLSHMLLSGCTYVRSEFRERLIQEANKQGEKQNLPASNMSRMPIRPGQWVKLLIEENKGSEDVILRTVKIIDIVQPTDPVQNSKEKSNNTLLKIEVENQSAYQKNKKITESYVIRNFPLEPPFLYSPREIQSRIYRIVFQSVRTKEQDKEAEDYPGQLLSFSRAWLTKLFITGHPLDNKEKPLPSACNNGWLDSPQCYSYKYKLNFLDINTTGQIWAHSEVPIFGFLQAKDDRYTYKVIAFGNSGAEATISPTLNIIETKSNSETKQN